ncbi:MAG: menaquinone biosynthesis protein [Planctomycetes bacterium]|nr:menaquinone biosynthesis protein [Planctomycetota bacterium]
MNDELKQNKTNVPPPFSVYAVSYFNTRPLIHNLDQNPLINLKVAPPAQLAQTINKGLAHAALIPSIDYQLSQRQWIILPVAAIGTRREVLTVRIFSCLPIDQIQILYCDTESHTSVALVQIIWHLMFNKKLTIKPLTTESSALPAVLLIGDKVIPHLNHWPYEFDLGHAWTEITGLPFVFAFWAAPADQKLDELIEILKNSYQQGVAHIEQIVDKYAAQHGLQPELAHKYLTENLCFEFNQPQKLALEKFYQLAHQLKITPKCRPLQFYYQPAQV